VEQHRGLTEMSRLSIIAVTHAKMQRLIRVDDTSAAPACEAGNPVRLV
jgi:hypothetical protein